MEEIGDGKYKTKSPDGYIFYLIDKEKQQGISSIQCQTCAILYKLRNLTIISDPVEKVSLGVSDLSKSIKYWHELLGMKLYEQNSDTALLGYGDDQCKLELVNLSQSVDHGTGFGRIAFSCPRDQLPEIEAKVKEAGHAIINPLVRLDTPGKAAVEVVILADVVSFCFVVHVSSNQRIIQNLLSLLGRP